MRLATIASGDRTVTLWDARTGKKERNIPRHGKPVSTVAFSPDGTKLATADGDKILRVWDVNTGQELSQFGGHTGLITAISFNADGNRVMSAGNDGRFLIYELDMKEVLRHAKELFKKPKLEPEMCEKFLHQTPCPPLPIID
jgi:WD40 repeat protein